MKPMESSPDDAARDECAAEWLCEAEDGFTPERARAFEAWRQTDRRNAEAVDRVRLSLALLQEAPDIRAQIMKRFGPMGAPGGAVTPPRRRQTAAISALAAAAVFAVLAVGAVFWRSADSDNRNFGEAAHPQRVTLSDRSVVDLNAHTSVNVAFNASERSVVLESGEACFQVARDSDRPFSVRAGGVLVKAVGTVFRVKLEAQVVDVLVLEGKVLVTSDSHRDPGPAAPPLLAGERVMMERDAPVRPARVERVAPASVQALLAWQNPMVKFENVPLREVAQQFNRRNATQLVILDVVLGERRIGGVLALDQVEAFVRLIEQDGDVFSERRGENEIVLRRKY